MKKSILILVVAAAIGFTACNNDAKEGKEASKEKQHDTHDGDQHKEGDGHEHDTTHAKDADKNKEGDGHQHDTTHTDADTLKIKK